MIHPTVHLNGTSKKELLNQWRAIYLALATARDTLRESGPNGRDYYPQGPDAIRTAETEHCERLAKIESVMEDLDELSLRVAFPDSIATPEEDS
jgi:hypothetical protein